MNIVKKYTSQTCSKCGDVNASSRSGEKYHCVSCNMKMDADKNAAINILHRGVCKPSTKQIKPDKGVKLVS